MFLRQCWTGNTQILKIGEIKKQRDKTCQKITGVYLPAVKHNWWIRFLRMVDGRWDICEQIVHENTHSAIAVTCWLEMWNSIFNYGRYHFSIRELFQYLSVLVIKELSMKSFDKKSSSDIKFKSETFKSSCIRSAFINNKVFILNILDRLWYLPTPTNNSAVPSGLGLQTESPST